MNKEAQQNASNLDDIEVAGIRYTVKKHAGAWVPVVIDRHGQRHTYAHCATAGGAMEIAIGKAANLARGTT